jgi:AraC-like DNA-binding protein
VRRRAFPRAAIRRLADALVQGAPHELLEAGVVLNAALADAEPSGAWPTAIAVLEALALSLPPHVSPGAARALEQTADALFAHSAPTPAVVVATLDLLWPRLAAMLAPEAEVDARVSLAAHLDEHLAAHLRGGATLREIARHLGYSTGHVSEMIRRATGMTFVALRRRMRVERACWLLRRGSSVKEAALASGFCDPAYFGRVFRRLHGTSPARWRATARRQKQAPLNHWDTPAVARAQSDS